MRDVLEKMREIRQNAGFPHDCGMVDTYAEEATSKDSEEATSKSGRDHQKLGLPVADPEGGLRGCNPPLIFKKERSPT